MEVLSRHSLPVCPSASLPHCSLPASHAPPSPSHHACAVCKYRGKGQRSDSKSASTQGIPLLATYVYVCHIRLIATYVCVHLKVYHFLTCHIRKRVSSKLTSHHFPRRTPVLPDSFHGAFLSVPQTCRCKHLTIHLLTCHVPRVTLLSCDTPSSQTNLSTPETLCCCLMTRKHRLLAKICPVAAERVVALEPAAAAAAAAIAVRKWQSMSIKPRNSTTSSEHFF